MADPSSPQWMSVPALLADRLRAAVRSGELAAGERINQDRVAQEAGVSHIPVREALRALEAEGLVTFHPRRGFFVAALSVADARDLGDLRAALEGLAARLAVPRAGVADLEAAREQIERSDRADSLAVWSEANWRFHRALYAPCGRPRLLETLEGLWRAADRYLRVVWQEAAWQGRSQEEHRAILEAFQSRDAALAGRLVRHHVLAATRELVKIMGQ
jgi:DNA-binding GntR family transcriptional regulator